MIIAYVLQHGADSGVLGAGDVAQQGRLPLKLLFVCLFLTHRTNTMNKYYYSITIVIIIIMIIIIIMFIIIIIIISSSSSSGSSSICICITM